MKKHLFTVVLMGLIVLSWSCGDDDNPAPTTLADCTATANTAPQSADATIESFRQAMLEFRNALPSELLASFRSNS